MLLEPQLCGVRCTFDPLIASLNYLGGGVGKDAYATVTCELMQKLFEKFGKGESKTTYDLLGIDGVDAGDLTLLIRNGIKRGKADRMYEICRGTEEQLVHLPKVGTPVPDHPMNKPSFSKVLNDLVPKEVRDELGVFLGR